MHCLAVLGLSLGKVPGLLLGAIPGTHLSALLGSHHQRLECQNCNCDVRMSQSCNSRVIAWSVAGCSSGATMVVVLRVLLGVVPEQSLGVLLGLSWLFCQNVGIWNDFCTRNVDFSDQRL